MCKDMYYQMTMFLLELQVGTVCNYVKFIERLEEILLVCNELDYMNLDMASGETFNL